MMWEHHLAPPFPTFQFPLNGLANDVGDLLPICQRCLDAVLCSLGESGGDLFEIYLWPAHLVDITY